MEEIGEKPTETTKIHPKNLMEWLKSREVPDSIRVTLVGLIATLTVGPYLGGRTLSVFGSTPISVPTVPEGAYWFMIFSAPVLWVLLVMRFIPTTYPRFVHIFDVTIGSSAFIVVIMSFFPWIPLDSISPNFDQTFQLGFGDVGHSWMATHRFGDRGETYCHFRTAPLRLNDRVQSGCTLRVDKISVEGGGRADVSEAVDKRAAFDLETFVGSDELLPETTECVTADKWENVKKRPINLDVFGHAIIYVSNSVGRGGLTPYSATYDFDERSISALPERGPFTELRRTDLSVSHRGVSGPNLGLDALGRSGHISI